MHSRIIIPFQRGSFDSKDALIERLNWGFGNELETIVANTTSCLISFCLTQLIPFQSCQLRDHILIFSGPASSSSCWIQPDSDLYPFLSIHSYMMVVMLQVANPFLSIHSYMMGVMLRVATFAVKYKGQPFKCSIPEIKLRICSFGCHGLHNYHL